MLKFKSVDPFYSKELSGIKNNTVRFDDDGERFKRLREFKEGDRLIIEITNTDTGFSFAQKIRDVSIYRNIYIITWEV